MIQSFNNMNELTEYLEKLEARVRSLEQENELMRPAPPARENVDGNAIARFVARSLPQTNLLNGSFFKRAFAVWGHFFVANLIISTIFFLIYACLMMVMFGSVFGSLVQNQP
jgi:hypothetical protein